MTASDDQPGEGEADAPRSAAGSAADAESGAEAGVEAGVEAGDEAGGEPAEEAGDVAGGVAAVAEAPRRRLTRRRLLGLFGAGAAGALAYRLARIDRPAKVGSVPLSRRAENLLAWAWEGIDPAQVVDVHVHLVGLGAGGTGCFVHPEAHSWSSPLRTLKTRIYKGAAGIWDEARADQVYVERLVDCAATPQPHGRFLLLAFDKHYTAAGEPDLARTEFYTPNDYLLQVCAEHPGLFLPGCSVHPYRADALEELERCREGGAVAVKWLPNAMGIDPADPRCDPFYERCAALGLVLLSHTGEEQAVHAEEAQELGNPLRLRRALDHGLTVIAAHCASLGENRDLDAAKDAAGERPRVSSYALFRRVMAENVGTPGEKGRLYGGLSALTQVNRCGDPLRETLAATELHPRLVNGSDYPLPAVDPLVQLRQLEWYGYVTAAERAVLSELFAYDPLVFDFVLKRCLKATGADGAEVRLPASAFETAHLFGG